MSPYKTLSIPLCLPTKPCPFHYVSLQNPVHSIMSPYKTLSIPLCLPTKPCPFLLVYASQIALHLLLVADLLIMLTHCYCIKTTRFLARYEEFSTPSPPHLWFQNFVLGVSF